MHCRHVGRDAATFLTAYDNARGRSCRSSFGHLFPPRRLGHRPRRSLFVGLHRGRLPRFCKLGFLACFFGPAEYDSDYYRNYSGNEIRIHFFL